MPGGNLAKEVAGRTARSAKEFVLPSKTGVIFEELGFTFLGPFDGHNTQEMVEVLRKARQMEGPVFIHVITKKGQGCDFAEADPTNSPGPGGYDPPTGVMKKSDGPQTFSAVFGKAMIEQAKRDPEVVAITAEMSEGTALTEFQQ